MGLLSELLAFSDMILCNRLLVTVAVLVGVVFLWALHHTFWHILA